MNKPFLNLLGALLLILVSLLACSEEPVPLQLEAHGVPSEPDCTYDYTIPANNVDSSVVINAPVDVFRFLERFSYSHPVFNPNNGNQIAYLRIDHQNMSPCNYELWTFDFCTGQTAFLCDQACYGVDWSALGWISFTGTDRQLYKIKASGDSLQQLTFSGDFNNNANWNDEGTQFTYLKKTGSTGQRLIADLNGNTIEEFENPFAGRFSWTGNFYAYDGYEDPYSGENAAIWLYDIDAKNIKYDYPIEICCSGDSIPHFVEYVPAQERIYWNNSSTLNYTDINTSKRTVLATGFENREYDVARVSPDHKKMIYHRVNYSTEDNWYLDITNHLYLIDTDGRYERRIMIPE